MSVIAGKIFKLLKQTQPFSGNLNTCKVQIYKSDIDFDKYISFLLIQKHIL